MENEVKLLVKGMACDRCIYVLKEEFSKLDLEISRIKLGEIVLKKSGKTPVETGAIKSLLEKHGFELLEDKIRLRCDRIKRIVEKGIQEQIDTGKTVKFSRLIGEELHKDYNSISTFFSRVEGITLEQFIISRKIERVKELLVYTDKSLSDIAYTLGYSSVAYLARQLKHHTGVTSSYFKKVRQHKQVVMKGKEL